MTATVRVVAGPPNRRPPRPEGERQACAWERRPPPTRACSTLPRARADYQPSQALTLEGDVEIATVVISDASLNVADLLLFSDIEGAFVITADGVAGFASASARLDVAGLSVSGDLSLRLNTMSSAAAPTLAEPAPYTFRDTAGGGFGGDGGGRGGGFRGATARQVGHVRQRQRSHTPLYE